MNAQTLNALVEEIIAEVNEEFRHTVIANQTKKGNIQLTLKTRKHYDEYEVEAKLGEVFDYVCGSLEKGVAEKKQEKIAPINSIEAI